MLKKDGMKFYFSLKALLLEALVILCRNIDTKGPR